MPCCSMWHEDMPTTHPFPWTWHCNEQAYNVLNTAAGFLADTAGGFRSSRTIISHSAAHAESSSRLPRPDDFRG